MNHTTPRLRMTRKIFTLALLSCLSFPIFGSEQPVEPGMIILLNGTSSAGKSSIIKELQKQSDNAFFVIGLDAFGKEYQKDNYDEYVDDFCKYIKSSSLIYPKILVDAVEYEEDYEKYDAIIGSGNIVTVLVYCPLHDILKRVKKRNQSSDEDDHRSIFQAFNQFLDSYKKQEESNEQVVDVISTSSIKNILREIKKESDEFDIQYPESIHERAEKYNKLVKRSEAQFHYNQQRKITLSPKQNYWDFIVNSGANLPQASARKIANFLETKN